MQLSSFFRRAIALLLIYVSCKLALGHDFSDNIGSVAVGTSTAAIYIREDKELLIYSSVLYTSILVTGEGFTQGMKLDLYPPSLKAGIDYDLVVDSSTRAFLNLRKRKMWMFPTVSGVKPVIRIRGVTVPPGTGPADVSVYPMRGTGYYGYHGKAVATVLHNPIVQNSAKLFPIQQSLLEATVIEIHGSGFTRDMKISIQPLSVTDYKILSVTDSLIRLKLTQLSLKDDGTNGRSSRNSAELLPPSSSVSAATASAGFAGVAANLTRTLETRGKIALSVESIDTGAGVIYFHPPVTIGYLVKTISSGGAFRRGSAVLCDDSCEFAFDGVCDEISGAVSLQHKEATGIAKTVDEADTGSGPSSRSGNHSRSSDGRSIISSNLRGAAGKRGHEGNNYYSDETDDVIMPACQLGTDCTDCRGTPNYYQPPKTKPTSPIPLPRRPLNSNAQSGRLVRTNSDYTRVTIILNNANFEAFVMAHEYVFVKFFAPWCIWCQRLSPIWDALAEKVTFSRAGGAGAADGGAASSTLDTSANVVVAEVDCVASVALCRSQRILAFPLMRLYRSGMPISPDYSSDRTISAFLLFLRQQIAPQAAAHQPGPSTNTIIPRC